jgi:hypothetical protein
MTCLRYLIILWLSCFGGTLLGASGFNDPDREIAPFTVPSTRNLALGGPHIAYTNDINSLFINPGAFRTTDELSIAQVSMGAYGDLLGLKDILNNMNDTSKLAAVFSKFITNSKGNVPLGFDLRGPVAFGNIKNGWGWGVFNRSYGGAEVKGRSVRIVSNVDLMANLGYSARIVDRDVHTLDLGFTGKAFRRMGIDSGSISLFDLSKGNDTLAERLNYVPVTMGMGLDLGLQYRLEDNFTAALTVNDLFSLGHVSFYNLNKSSSAGKLPGNYVGHIKPVVNLGVSYKIFDNDLVSWAIMADYRDIAALFQQHEYDSRNAWLNLSVGTEVTLFKHLSFRAGMNEMLPAVGIGFDLFICKLDAAFYGRELGNDPGKLSTYALDVGLLFQY